jgi:thiol-disulfide isomerase/thioredoxin
MKKLIKVFIIVFLLLGFQSSAQTIPKWKIGELENYIKQSAGPVIVNFWATFCKPCIEEMPYFQKLVKKYEKEGIELLLVSLDLKEAYTNIPSFAAKYKLNSKIVYLDETNADLFCPKIDEKWSGAIPASLFVNNKTGFHKFFEEQIPEKKLEEQIKALIGK